MSDERLIKSRLDALSKQPFRAKFHLGDRELSIVQTKGIEVMREHAADLFRERVAPATPKNDGKQTPFRGYPVFIAQHATATCCRSCLAKWHQIPKGRELTESEISYASNVITEWITRDLNFARSSRFPV